MGKANIPSAVQSKYDEAVKKRAALAAKSASLQAQIEKHDLVLSGMSEIMTALSAEGAVADTQKTKNPESPQASDVIRPANANVWSDVLEWIGRQEVRVEDVFNHCQEKEYVVTRKQIRNWLNNTRISGKLQRVGKGVYRGMPLEMSLHLDDRLGQAREVEH